MTLTERLQAQLTARSATDPQMRAILRRIQAGTASFSDTALYTRYLGEMLGGILADALPDAAPEEIAEAARVLLREAHADVTAQAAIVQEIQDRQLGASLAAKRPKYPAGRVEKVASSLADQTVPVETRQRRARNASANVVASYHDTFIKENARIRSDAGFSCKTVRLGTQCCPWCAKLTGSYPAGSEPRDLFRRHDNCTCTIIYETRRTRQTLRGQGKSWNVVEEVERKAPTRFSRDEAKALQEAEMGRYRGLTLARESDIIEINKAAKRDEIKWLPKGEDLTPEARKRLTDHAKKCNIVLTGLRRSDVDETLVREIIDNAASMLKVYPELNADPARPFTIKIVNGLEANVFAQTTRRTSQNVVQINANAFRDGAKLSEEYGKLAADKWFVKGTDHSAIVKHEIGHMYQAIHKISDDTIVETAMRVSRQTDRKSLFRFLTENLSEYAGSYKDGSEIISEVFADYYGSKEPTEFSVAFMGALNEMR